MAQETFYFSHDYNPLDDPKLQSFVSVYGASGYGVYWRVVERLHSDLEHKLPLKKYTYLSIAGQLSLPCDNIKEMVESCIETFELFISDGECFWSNRVNINIAKRAEIVEKKSKAGKASAKARKRLQDLAEKYPDLDVSDLTGVEHVLTDVEHVSTKESK